MPKIIKNVIWKGTVKLNLILKFYKITEKLKRVIFSIWLSYLAGISVEFISNSSSFSELLYSIFDLSKISVLILWCGAVIVMFVWGFNIIFDKIRISNKIEKQFAKIMKEHTFEVLNMAEMSTYSWGYNKAMYVSHNLSGWKPEDIYIDLKNSIIESDFTFNASNTKLQSYNDESYNDYCNENEKIHTIRQRADDKERYGVLHVEKSMKGNKIEIRLQKTKWTQLQYSWDYLRRLDTHNEAVTHPSENENINGLFIKAINHNENLLINSFCLHLILVSNNGKVILSKISMIKSNDYPSTWAATIGEQIEREDFLNDTNGELYSNFVTRWVKRALKEELGIDENSLTEKGISELDEYVDMSSLRALSVDFEGDIYNVALTCLLKLNINANQLKLIKEIKMDNNEITNDFIECTESEVRKILLEYPDNKKDYHPSTYLRLLMFHLYSYKQSATMSAIVKENKKMLYK